MQRVLLFFTGSHYTQRKYVHIFNISPNQGGCKFDLQIYMRRNTAIKLRKGIRDWVGRELRIHSFENSDPKRRRSISLFHLDAPSLYPCRSNFRMKAQGKAEEKQFLQISTKCP